MSKVAEFVTLAVFPRNERAQRAYRAFRFVIADLSTEGCGAMRAVVDPVPEDCLVMIARPAV